MAVIQKRNMPLEKAQRREGEPRRHSPKAWIEGFERPIEAMTNDPGDRHILAAAVRAHTHLIDTYNRRHFPDASLQTWEIEVRGPSAVPRGVYDRDAGFFFGKLLEQAARVGVSLTCLLQALAKNVQASLDTSGASDPAIPPGCGGHG